LVSGGLLPGGCEAEPSSWVCVLATISLIGGGANFAELEARYAAHHRVPGEDRREQTPKLETNGVSWALGLFTRPRGLLCGQVIAILRIELNVNRKLAHGRREAHSARSVAGHPERTAAQISPDGKRWSYVASLDGVLNVFIGKAGTRNERRPTHDTAREIQGYLWAHDNRHVMYTRD
jgi:hypothetical protein